MTFDVALVARCSDLRMVRLSGQNVSFARLVSDTLPDMIGVVNRTDESSAYDSGLLSMLLGFVRFSDLDLESGVVVRTGVREDLVTFIVCNYLFGEASRIPGDDDSLIETGVIDSTGILELIEFLEANYGIEVHDDETVPQNLGSIGNLLSFITTKQQVVALA